MPSFPIRRLAATAASAALLLTVLATAPAQAAGPAPDPASAAPIATASASTGATADLSDDMMQVPAAPLLKAQTDDEVSPAVGVTTSASPR
jgi:hypothetical protein